MQLPLLSEEQEKMVRRYGSEHCDEMLIVERGGGAVVAGVLIQPFKTKKVAQTSFGINLKSWKITPPKYVRGWYRELSSEEYTAEFDGVPRVLGRRMQATQRELYALKMLAEVTREQEVRAKAQRAQENRERACRLLAGLANRHMKTGFEFLAAPIRQCRQEESAKKIADYKAMMEAERAAEIKVVEDKKKAEAEYAELMKCPAFREKVHLARIAEEKRLQAKNVAYHAAEKEKKNEAHLARIAEEKKLQEANVAAPEKETKKRRIEQIREWP